MTDLSVTNAARSARTQPRTCPDCGSLYLDRIERRLIDRIIGLVVPLKRYHCGSCGWKGNIRLNLDQV